jgi:sulfatase modifying factor 1
VNWLHNGQGNGDTESGAYLNVGNQVSFARQANAKYWIPTENEWYKAAYYDPAKGGGAGYWDYPTGSDSLPSNALDPKGGNNANFYYGGYTIGPDYYTTEVGAFKNSDSPYGTFDQGGNLREWNEEVIGSSRGLRGGDWYYTSTSSGLLASERYDIGPSYENYNIGFRVASSEVVPEPGSITLILSGVLAGLLWWRRRK